jgi:hypothetical protein
MLEVPSTPREIAKHALQMVVALKTAEVVKEQLTEHTDMNPDGIPVKVVSGTSGYLVAAQAKPHTDRIVEEAATRIERWRQNRNNKVSEPQ